MDEESTRLTKCKTCEEFKPQKAYELVRKWRKKTCRACDARRKYHRDPDKTSKKRKERRQRLPATHIMQDSRKSDKKAGRDGNNITTLFVQETIKYGCKYCGETSLRMTLDRIDNSLAHTVDNVVPACIRCNLTRRSMPYDAWTFIAPRMREARELGLFDGWKF
jgi:hypothetical protein